jgi:hypothetical protein
MTQDVMPRRAMAGKLKVGIAVGLTGAGLLALAGCEKPGPGVSVVSGTTSEWRESLCWSFSGEPLSPETCAQDIVTQALDGSEVARIPVIPGGTVGISVDPVVADAGWYPVVGSQRLTQQAITSTYYRFTYPDLQQIPEDGIALQVVAGQGESTVGLWVFQLVPDQGVE